MSFVSMIVPTLIFVVGVVDDLRLKKIPNQHTFIFAAVSLLSTILISGGTGLVQGVLACSLALALTLPLVLGKVLGAGDMKLLAAASLILDWRAVSIILVSSLVWGALLGVVRAALDGRAMILFKNTAQLMGGRKADTLEMTKIPFAVALTFGWFTYLGSFSWGGIQI